MNCARCGHDRDAHAGDKDCMCGACMWFVSTARAKERAEAALTEERERHAALRRDVEALANSWSGEAVATPKWIMDLRAVLDSHPTREPGGSMMSPEERETALTIIGEHQVNFWTEEEVLDALRAEGWKSPSEVRVIEARA